MLGRCAESTKKHMQKGLTKQSLLQKTAVLKISTKFLPKEDVSHVSLQTSLDGEQRDLLCFFKKSPPE